MPLSSRGGVALLCRLMLVSIIRRCVTPIHYNAWRQHIQSLSRGTPKQNNKETKIEIIDFAVTKNFPSLSVIYRENVRILALEYAMRISFLSPLAPPLSTHIFALSISFSWRRGFPHGSSQKMLSACRALNFFFPLRRCYLII